MEFIIVTGLSGAGKTRSMHALEDIGFYCVDNIPPELISTFYDLCCKANESIMRKVAVVTDIRGNSMFSSLFETLEKLRLENKTYKILFLDAREDVLIKRFKETRRRHPLYENYLGSVAQAVKLEREILRPIREKADYIIDTSLTSPAQLKSRISSLFLGDITSALMVTCMSFGFKYGLPYEADLVFDVRCLPNPYYIEELKPFTGLDECVNEYVMKWEQTKGFVQRMIDLIDYSMPLYCSEGKSQLVIAVGCTGGKHRSVAVAQSVYDHLIDGSGRIGVNHRDIHKA